MTQTPEWSPQGETPSAPPPGPTPPPYSYPPGAYPPGPYPGSYPPPPMPYGSHPGMPAPMRNGIGIAALIVAVIAVLGSPFIIGGVIGVVAVILGFVGRARARRGEANNGGVALAGIIVGVVAIVVALASVAFWVGLFRDVGAGSYFDCLQQAGDDRARVQMCADEFRQSVEDKFSVTPTP